MTKRIEALDGLRGLAALSVLAAHTLPLPASNTIGPFGVELFFALSGFLCGSILIGSQAPGVFYLRRAFRILPLYFVTAGLCTLYRGYHVPAWTLWTLNVDYTLARQPWGAVEGSLWTIAAEEHAYLLLPWIAQRRSLLWGLVAVAVVSRLAVHVQFWIDPTSIQPMASYCFTLCRIDGIALGALLAHWVRERSAIVGQLSQVAPWLLLARCAFLFGANNTSIPVEMLGPVCAVAIVAWVVSREQIPVLSSVPLMWVGGVSYGVYMLHGFVKSLLPESPLLGAQVLAVTLVVAWASFRWFEQPFLRSGHALALRQRLRSVATEEVHVERGGAGAHGRVAGHEQELELARGR